MRSNHHVEKSILLCVAAFLSIGMASAQATAATSPISFCTSWRAQYGDSSGRSDREDWYTSQSAMDLFAQYSEYSIWWKNGSTWELVDRYSLYDYNSSLGKYCTPTRYLTVGQTYRFRQYTRLQRGNRVIYVMDSTSTISSPQREYWDYDYVVPSYSSTHYVSITQTAMSPSISLATVARQYLVLADSLGDTRQSSHIIYVEPNQTECNGDYAEDRGNSVIRVCYPSSSGIINKFVSGHEMGHALSIVIGGPFDNSYDADSLGVFSSSLSQYCKCAHLPASMNSHCLQSREYIGAASSEGFAHMVATSLYNARSSDSWFHYYKNVLLQSGTQYAPWESLGIQTHWVRSTCAPASSDFGGISAEWDWSQFFWQLWGVTANGQFNMADVVTVWSNTYETTRCCSSTSNCSSTLPKTTCEASGKTYAPFGKLWEYRSNHPSGLTYLVDTAIIQYGQGSDKFNRFYNLGSSTGVNY